MAKWIKWTPEQCKAWSAWVVSCPAVIQEVIKKYNLHADELFTLKTTGQRVTLYSFEEDGTVSVNVLYQFNHERMLGDFSDRRVFGINPADLEACDWEGVVVDAAAEDTATGYFEPRSPVSDILKYWHGVKHSSKDVL